LSLEVRLVHLYLTQLKIQQFRVLKRLRSFPLLKKTTSSTLSTLLKSKTRKEAPRLSQYQLILKENHLLFRSKLLKAKQDKQSLSQNQRLLKRSMEKQEKKL